MGTTPQFISTVRTPAVSIANADATNFKVLHTAGTLGSRIDSIIGINTDAANPYTVQMAVQKSAVNYELGEVVIAAGAGTNGTAKSVAMLNPTDIPGLTYMEDGALFLEGGASLVVRSKTTVSGSNQLKFAGFGGDY